MDCISPDHLETGLSDLFIRVSLNAIRAAIPFDAADTEESHDEKYQAAVQLFHSLEPRNPGEAALATRYVISHVRCLHLSARAAARGLEDDKSVRLHAAAATADRLANTTRRALEAAQKPAPGNATRRPVASEPAPSNPQSTIAPDDMGPFDDPTLGPLPAGADGWVRFAPGARPTPHYTFFQPRDCHGEPIPLYRHELMTKAQFRAVNAFPRDPELDAAAIAEEEQMIAAQAAKDAAAPTDAAAS